MDSTDQSSIDKLKEYVKVAWSMEGHKGGIITSMPWGVLKEDPSDVEISPIQIRSLIAVVYDII